MSHLNAASEIIKVLYEDQWIIAINKPSGIPSEPTVDKKRINLYGLTKSFLARKNSVPEESVYLARHHRLDLETSGVIIFAKDPSINSAITKLFEAHQIIKIYNAITEIKDSKKITVEHAWVTKNYLKGIKIDGKVKMEAVKVGGDVAITNFKILKISSKIAFVEAVPKTGRTHQIRVHLSENKMPIVGDVYYGAKSESKLKSRVMLHAKTLIFEHPILGQRIHIDSELPEDFNKILTFLK